MLRSYPLFQMAAVAPIPRWAEPLGARSALRAALHAYRRVPAYRDFVEAATWVDDRSLNGTDRLMRLPVMDKQNYIQRYPTAKRCLDGQIPLVGTEMDESSGSSGTPLQLGARLDGARRGPPPTEPVRQVHLS
jgi:hypothetical protein